MHPYFIAFKSFLSKIPFINSGGCAYAALAMYKLGKRLGMDIHIMYLYDDVWDYNSNCVAFNGVDKPASCSHAICVIGEEWFDCKAIVPVPLYIRSHFVTEELVIRSLKECSSWNYVFNKDMYVPEIESVLGEKLLKLST